MNDTQRHTRCDRIKWKNLSLCVQNMRKVRKALAVKLVYQAYLYQEIQTILDV
ncbi:MAG: hypothetical protein V7K65_03425 [Nostoc sp.]